MPEAADDFKFLCENTPRVSAKEYITFVGIVELPDMRDVIHADGFKSAWIYICT